MKYYRLEDREHKDIIVKANGAEQYIDDLYTEITEEEAKKYCLL